MLIKLIQILLLFIGMDLLASLMENMTLRTRGVSTERVSFLEDVMDQSSRKMVSKSLSKVGKSKQMVQQQKQKTIKAVYKFSMLLNKKLKAMKFVFFVNLESFNKIECSKLKTDITQIDSSISIGNTKDQSQKVLKQFPLNKDKIITNMVNSIQVIYQKFYSKSHLAIFFSNFCKVGNKRIKLFLGMQQLKSYMCGKINSLQQEAVCSMKNISRQVDKIDFLVSVVQIFKRKYQNFILGGSFQQIFGYMKQSRQIDQSKGNKLLTQQSSFVSLVSEMKDIKTLSDKNNFKEPPTEIINLQQKKIKKFNLIKQRSNSKSAVFDLSQYQENNMDFSTSKIAKTKIQKNIINSPLEIQMLSNVVTFPKQESICLFFQKQIESKPKQLHRIYPDEVSNQIPDIQSSFMFFQITQRTNSINDKVPSSKTKSHKMLNESKKICKVISLKNSIIKPRQLQNSFCYSKKGIKQYETPRSKKSFGLTSSRRIKQYCVGQEWERFDASRFRKSQWSSPAKEGTSKVVLTTRPKCIKSISIMKAEVLFRQKNDDGKDNSRIKKITSVCSELPRKTGKL